jgi:hypothetical protein
MDTKPKKVEIKKSKTKGKKWDAIFYNNKGKKIQTTSFGGAGYSDYTIHKDPRRKERYIKRHKKREDWEKPMTAGSLSRYILWEKPDFKKSVDFYKKRFNLQ